MSEIPSIISNLAIILTLAGFTTVLFKWMKQPVVLGYIVAGFLSVIVMNILSTEINTHDIHIWSDIGVIFLLFSLGLDFSLKKLMNVGVTALSGALTVVIGMMSVGYLAGSLMGWSSMDCIFLGGMLSMSSTTIIFKAFDDSGLRTEHFSQIVFGILIVEDLFAVLLMVMLSTLAISHSVNSETVLADILKLFMFLLFCFVTGIYLLPTLFRKTKQYLNNETLLVLSIGLCLAMVMIASTMGFSSALGAFLMGSILAETIEAEHIEKLITPVKDLFGAIFFVSVGMMINPELLWQYKFPILILTVLVIVGQISFSSFGILLSGKSLQTAIRCSFSLAQIGEFAFILAALGNSLQVTKPFLYPIVVAVSVITTFSTPYLIQLALPTSNYLDRIIPLSWRKFFDRFSAGSNTIKQKNDWHDILPRIFRTVATFSCLSIFITVLWLQFVAPLIMNRISGIRGNLIALVALLLILAPFIRPVMLKRIDSHKFKRLWNDTNYNRGPIVSIFILRFIIGIVLIMYPVGQLLSGTLSVSIATISVLAYLAIGSRRIKKQTERMETRFYTNLSARETLQKEKTPVGEFFSSSLLKRDLHMSEFIVPQNSHYVGQQLVDLKLRNRLNINIVAILRGEKRINIPDGTVRLFPFDKALLVGLDENIKKFNKLFKESVKADLAKCKKSKNEKIFIEQLRVINGSHLAGKTIMESGIQKEMGCIVIAVERESISIQNPKPTFLLAENDLIWVVGEPLLIKALNDKQLITN